MSEKEISIKLNICDRFYPLRISTSEEGDVRKAAKTINERARYYIDNFSVQDKQDALSMVSLELATGPENKRDEVLNMEKINKKLQDIEKLLIAQVSS